LDAMTDGASLRVYKQLLSSTLSIHDELNMQKPCKIRSARGFWEITWVLGTCHKVSVSQKSLMETAIFESPVMDKVELRPQGAEKAGGEGGAAKDFKYNAASPENGGVNN